jgi:hypothetical protein
MDEQQAVAALQNGTSTGCAGADLVMQRLAALEARVADLETDRARRRAKAIDRRELRLRKTLAKATERWFRGEGERAFRDVPDALQTPLHTWLRGLCDGYGNFNALCLAVRQLAEEGSV